MSAFSKEAHLQGELDLSICPSPNRNQISPYPEEHAELRLRFFWTRSDDRYLVPWNGDQVLNVAVEREVRFIAL